ncbi:MAG: helix-turn-helix transcriptional regulator [Kangiellaceae bacterium]|nr:helix-turn-helix transcriptional regulator [Kangiellaceae bacterium]
MFDSLHFHPSHLLKKPVVSETLIDQIIHQQFDLQTNQKQPNLVALVEHTIKMLLVTGECTKESTALCINIHSKKLQRLLKSENTSYQNILDTVRKKEATRQLRNLSINLTEVALNLGFSEFSVFSRKFKNWFGIAPSLWRKKEASNAILGS